MKKEVWVTCRNAAGLEWLERRTVVSRRRKAFDPDRLLHMVTDMMMAGWTLVLCFAAAPMAWAIWNEALKCLSM